MRVLIHDIDSHHHYTSFLFFLPPFTSISSLSLLIEAIYNFAARFTSPLPIGASSTLIEGKSVQKEKVEERAKRSSFSMIIIIIET